MRAKLDNMLPSRGLRTFSDAFCESRAQTQTDLQALIRVSTTKYWVTRPVAQTNAFISQYVMETGDLRRKIYYQRSTIKTKKSKEAFG